jgi:hypothetical protein
MQQNRPTHAPTPQQQLVLERIAAQRERIRARQQAHASQKMVGSQNATAAAASTDASFVEKLVLFTREHPSVLALAAAAAVAAGPRRILRWASVILPLVMRNKRL